MRNQVELQKDEFIQKLLTYESDSHNYTALTQTIQTANNGYYVMLSDEATLIADEIEISGCQFLINIQTKTGQITFVDGVHSVYANEHLLHNQTELMQKIQENEDRFIRVMCDLHPSATFKPQDLHQHQDGYAWFNFNVAIQAIDSTAFIEKMAGTWSIYNQITNKRIIESAVPAYQVQPE